MSRIRGKDTKPEILVRKYLYAHGIRYRLHAGALPGKPDIVMHKRRVALFVNGCFWHGHSGCKYATTPKTNTDFWLSKISRNVERDEQNHHKLEQDGWRVLIIWACELGKERDIKLSGILDSIRGQN